MGLVGRLEAWDKSIVVKGEDGRRMGVGKEDVVGFVGRLLTWGKWTMVMGEEGRWREMRKKGVVGSVLRWKGLDNGLVASGERVD